MILEAKWRKLNETTTTTTNVHVHQGHSGTAKFGDSAPTRSTQPMPGGRIQSLSIFSDDQLHSIAFRQQGLEALIEVHEKPAEQDVCLFNSGIR